MSDMYDKICPLLKSNIPAENKCKGSRCAFAAPKHKTSVDKDGEIRFENNGWYCLVRDFLLTIANRE